MERTVSSEEARDLECDALIEKLAGWIDPYVIAELIVDNLEENEEELTFENGKGVWLRQLEELGAELAGGLGLEADQ